MTSRKHFVDLVNHCVVWKKQKNVDMNASTAAVYESKTSGIVNTLHALLDKAKSRSDVGTKADIYIVALHIVLH